MTIVHEDMRAWQPACKADILVSELLGSFGDNELSPECLDGAQRYLKGPIASLLLVHFRHFESIQRMESAFLIRTRPSSVLFSRQESIPNCFTTEMRTNLIM